MARRSEAGFGGGSGTVLPLARRGQADAALEGTGAPPLPASSLDPEQYRVYSAQDVQRLLQACQIAALARCYSTLTDPDPILPQLSEAYSTVVRLTAALQRTGGDPAPAWAGTPEDTLAGAVDVIRRLRPEAQREALEAGGVCPW